MPQRLQKFKRKIQRDSKTFQNYETLFVYRAESKPLLKYIII